MYMVKNRKSEHRYWILHIRISLGTKFQLKRTILILWTKFAQKGLSLASWAHFTLTLFRMESGDCLCVCVCVGGGGEEGGVAAQKIPLLAFPI